MTTDLAPAIFGSNKSVHSGPSDGWHGMVAADSRFAPEAGRYHLYIGLFCPFAHRANLVRELKGLGGAIIPTSVVRPYPKGDDGGWPGWRFIADGPPTVEEPSDGAGAITAAADFPEAAGDALFGSRYLHELYFRADPAYAGRYSVPLLWDTRTSTAVSNESAELLRWLGAAFDGLVPDPARRQAALDLYPLDLRAEIDEVSGWMQADLNAGVYKAGFAESQQAYDRAVLVVFAALNRLEKLVHGNGGPYVLGERLTELDIRAYATLIRFDVVYVRHFMCNLGTIRANYPVLHEWLKNLYWNVKGFKETTNFDHIKANYFKSHPGLNPKAIIPKGPFPNIESGVNLNFKDLKPGSVDHPEVLELEASLHDAGRKVNAFSDMRVLV